MLFKMTSYTAVSRKRFQTKIKTWKRFQNKNSLEAIIISKKHMENVLPKTFYQNISDDLWKCTYEMVFFLVFETFRIIFFLKTFYKRLPNTTAFLTKV